MWSSRGPAPWPATLAPGGIMLSHPSDAFEQAAERSADRVTGEGGAGPAGATAQATSVQRQEEEKQPEETAQRMVVQRASEEEEQPEEGGE
jgi:hypothetical protein